MMDTKINSLQNPRIKRVVKLRAARNRRAGELAVIEGVREVALAAANGVDLEEVFLCPEYFQAHQKMTGGRRPRFGKARVYEVTPAVFDKIAFGARREGLTAVGRPPAYNLDDLPESPGSFYVVLDGLEKPGNLGAILRTADAAGVDAVLVTGPRTDIYNPNVIRASLGAVFCRPVVQAETGAALDFLRRRRVEVVVALPQAGPLYFKTDFSLPLALVLGGEEQGVSDFWKKSAGRSVRIPMTGRVDSLNVASSAAILMYDVVRQRGER